MFDTIIAWVREHIALSAIGSTVLALASVPTKSWFTQRSERARLRRALYREMADDFSRLIFLSSPMDPNPPHGKRHEAYWQKIGLHGINFIQDVYNSAKGHPSFRELPEASTIDDYYAWINRILTPRQTDDVVVLFREAVFWVVREVQAGRLNRKLLIASAPDFATEDVRRITSETRESLHRNWLSFGQ